MLLALDVGNTNITIGRIEGGKVADVWRLATRPTPTTDALDAALDGADEVVMGSVVPTVSSALTDACARRNIGLLVADADTIPMPMRVDQPREVGADRLVNAFAALRLYGAPSIVIDLGTATTFDVVDAGGAFVGGAIAPGIELGLEALASRTALLPRVKLALPKRAIGATTVDAIQSGAVIGYIGLVHELLARIEDEIAPQDGPGATVILTGGLSQAHWAQEILADEIDPDLTLRGLAILHAEITSAARTTSPA